LVPSAKYRAVKRNCPRTRATWAHLGAEVRQRNRGASFPAATVQFTVAVLDCLPSLARKVSGRCRCSWRPLVGLCARSRLKALTYHAAATVSTCIGQVLGRNIELRCDKLPEIAMSSIALGFPLLRHRPGQLTLLNSRAIATGSVVAETGRRSTALDVGAGFGLRCCVKRTCPAVQVLRS